MLNVRTLDLFLRTLQARGETPATAQPATPVSAATTLRRVELHEQRVPPTRFAPDTDPAPLDDDEASVAGPRTLARGTPPTTATASRSPASAASAGDKGASAPSRAAANAARASVAAVDGELAASDPARAAFAAPENAKAALLALSPAAVWLQKTIVPDHVTDARITPPRALLDSPPSDAGDLAGALRTSVAESGLFYESHLAAWTIQQYAASELKREPQAAWHTQVLHDDDSGASASRPTEIDAQGADATTLLAPHSTANAPVDLVRAQLAALDARRFAWEGELWPGQHAKIEIGEERVAHDELQEPQAWRTTIALTLPRLGRVEARVYASRRSLQLEIVADDSAAVERLRGAQRSLVSALEARAQNVTALSIRAA